ncbi:hypothetical protein [uncultured Cedecea sp.]|uniref:hypothetical protein n=1 Tax=uncultured Cedecea sp. TaxID=988762 RepID=UPI0026181DEC|nr:hypothetical protein [uncultured Cedecea sp.]
MLSNLERWVAVHEFKIKPSHDEADFLPFTDVVNKLKTLFDNKEAYKMYNTDTRAIRISDFRFEPADDCLTMLIQLSDKRVANPVFADLSNGTLREEPKLEGEGVAVSAHFVIKCTPTQHSADHYKVLVECVPGLTKSVFEPFLSAMFRKAYENEEFKSKLSGKVYKLRPVLEVLSYASETLEESLLGSRLQGLRLISTSRVDGMDKNPYTHVVEKSLKLKVVKQPGAAGKKRLFASIRKRGEAEGYNKLIISFSKDGKQSSIDIDVKDDAATKLFTKLEKIILPDGIKQCEPSILDDMEERMKKVL